MSEIDDVTSEIDDVHPLFFLSYARSHIGGPSSLLREPDKDVITFFNDLSDNVARLVSRRAGADPGFMDRSIRPGQRWTEELLHAVGTCDVFVPLLCVPYTSSRWCGMEWYAFSQRNGAGGAIIPVIWAPFSEQRIPAIVNQVQRFSPGDLPDVEAQAEYEQHGVSGLIWLMRMVPYRWVVWRLAREIAQRHHGIHTVDQRTLGEDELRNAFGRTSHGRSH
jgi:TIR domain-containing protein